MASSRVVEPYLSGKGGRVCNMCKHMSSDRELEASGVAVASLSSSFHLHSCRPTHSSFRTPKFVQISDHGEPGPSYREGTVCPGGRLSEHKKYSCLNIKKKIDLSVK